MPRIFSLPRIACRALRRFLRARAGMPELVPPPAPGSAPLPPKVSLDPLEHDLTDQGDNVPTPLLVDPLQQTAPDLEPPPGRTTMPSTPAAKRRSSRPPTEGEP